MSENNWLIFHGTQLLLRHKPGQGPGLPRSARPPLPVHGQIHMVGSYDDGSYAAFMTAEAPFGPDWTAVDVRAAYDILPAKRHAPLARARQLMHWQGHSRFCASCGARLTPASPISKHCPACGEEIFPTMAMAILVLVHKGDCALLARGRNFKGPYYSCLAGYVEPGETLEECVRREIMEETALTVEDVRYFASQPWPFPSLLMAGFTARYVSGDIVVQESELRDAAFFPRNALPELPPAFTLARQIIDAWAGGAA